MIKLSLINKKTKNHRTFKTLTYEELYLLLKDEIKLDSLGEELENYIKNMYDFDNVRDFENNSCYELDENDFVELIFTSLTLDDYSFRFKEMN